MRLLLVLPVLLLAVASARADDADTLTVDGASGARPLSLSASSRGYQMNESED
jgi:hypothetical protein